MAKDIKTETIATITFFKNRFVTMIETPTFLSSDIIAEKEVTDIEDR